VAVDGVDVRSLAPGELAKSAALVPQQTFLFDDTVRENVTLGEPIEDAEIWSALRVAQADGFVARLPAGLDTRLGERGATLSGGQRQRLALARALVRRPRLLVLDDATSAVDPEVEARILTALREHTEGGTTVLVVAYRNATISLADDVLFLEQGRIVDRGPHADLIQRSAGYRALVTAYEVEAERRRVDRESDVLA
jgi:ABC-type multidrug transport system fused ATPase/permease subunit